MSEQRGNREQEATEYRYEDKHSETKPLAGISTEERPPEDDGGPGSDGEEVHKATTTDETQADLHIYGGMLGDPQETESSIAIDVLETSAEEAETQADLPDDAERFQRKDHVENSTATVKVVLVPEGHVMTEAFAIGLSIQELKHHLASELRVPSEVLRISLDGREVEEQQSLMELGIQPHSATRMEMSSSDPTTHPLRPPRPPVHDNMPDVITVPVQTDGGVFKEVVVEIERPSQQKPFLGGYRNRLTGTEYHHAAVQTLPKKRPDRGVVMFSCDTQTAEMRSHAQQCPASVYTQTTDMNCYVSCRNEMHKVLYPKTYITADEYHSRRLRAVIQLQSFARRWLACKEVDRMRRERDRRTAWLEAQERRRMKEKEEQMKDHYQRWKNPQRRDDFNLLYHSLEKWRFEEEKRINSTLKGAERRAALLTLLEQEMQLIAAIERQRITVQDNNYDKAVKNFLDKSAAPLRWRAAGHLIDVDNQNTIRARELKDLYNNINLFTVNRDQRIHILKTLRHTVMEYKCPLTRDIEDLIDREMDLMTRVKAASLEGLRKRIATLFLQFIKTPAFNPEVSKLLKVPQDPSKLKNKMSLCQHCRRCLQVDDFKTLASGCLSSQCRSCTKLQNIAGPCVDFYCFNNILKRLRADELRLNEEAKIPFLLQVEDMRYLVEIIWSSCSALSGSRDLYNLVFVRWDTQRAWSPWNCILLSKEEASAHMDVKDIHKEYDATFFHRMEHNHRLARRHFSQFSVLAKYLASQPATALGNQIVSKPITMATGREVEEQQSLMELGIQPHSATRMEMSSSDPTTHPLRPPRPPVHDNMPDVITVPVQTDGGVFKEVVVEIERPSQQKPFLGGYRNRLTGTEYHHAAVQTLPKKRPDRGVVMFSCDIQTAEMRSHAQQCPATVYTQTTDMKCKVSCLNEMHKVLYPKTYITADEYHSRRLRAVIQLQSFSRRWLACKEVDRMRRERDRRTAWLEAQERRRMKEKEEQMKDHYQRWKNPQRRDDFNLLYHSLEKWRFEEEKRINSTLKGAERRAALLTLLEQEMQLIAAIERQRITVQDNNYDKAVKNFLDKSAAPLRWRAAGHLIDVDNQNTIRARELKDLYTNINLFTVNRDQRIHILKTLRHIVMEYECPLTWDIEDLIDREMDLMTQVKATSLEGLRKRIATLFLQFIKTPAFNPEVSKLLKVPQDPSKLKNKMSLCQHCRRCRHVDDFKTLASGRLSSQCRSCCNLQNIAGPRVDLYCFNNILKRLRADELRLNEEAKIPFLLQVEDMRYLVEIIWSSCSALSGSRDLYNLVFVRWDTQRAWSPWNCILLSKEEASAHMDVEDIHKEYDATFFHRMEHNHRLARRHFSQFSVLAKYLASQPATALGK